MGVALAGSIRFANADPNSHSYNNTCADSHAYCNAYSNTDTYSDTDAQRHTKA